MSIGVVVAHDDHPLMLRTLEGLLRSERDFEVLAKAPNGDEAVRSVRPQQSYHLRAGREAGELRTRMVLLAASLADEDMLAATSLGVGGLPHLGLAARSTHHAL